MTSAHSIWDNPAIGPKAIRVADYRYDICLLKYLVWVSYWHIETFTELDDNQWLVTYGEPATYYTYVDTEDKAMELYAVL